MRQGTAVITLIGALVVGGCSVTVPGEPAAARSNRTSARPLPFSPTVKNRTNDRNDGTPFEPCSAYSDSELHVLDIDPTSVQDAAQVDSANYRGCRWREAGYTAARGGGDYSQIVGLKMSLKQYKHHMSTKRWQTDRMVDGRRLALYSENNYCSAVFASEQAIVVTIAGSTNPSPGRTVECARAVAFATLAITKAP
ncbi:DUF3558 domain-containing protein [Tsukamurella sp. NPDC003166]|uniref:DUF3558 domain-containing protein n=1 Tax=Tsukamurella sp. NPDC003166 TaxID=3154444 RepID=UPI0033AD70E8